MVRLLNVMCGNNNNSSRASKHLVMTLQISTCTQLGVLDGRRLDNEADIVTAELSTPARLQNKDLPSLTTAKHSERNDHFAVCVFFFFPPFRVYCRWPHKVVKLSEKSLESALHEDDPEALLNCLCWFSLYSEVRFYVVLWEKKTRTEI